MGSTIGWVPRSYVEPISEEMADALKAIRSDMRLSTQVWDSTPHAGSASSLRPSFVFGSPDMSVLSDTESWDQRSVRGIASIIISM